MSRFPWVAPRGRVLSWRSAVAAGALVVIGVLITVQTGGIGPAGTDAGSAHMLKAGVVSGLGAGSPGGLNANAHEPGAGSFPPVTVTPSRHSAAAAPASSPAAPSQRDLPSASTAGFAPYVDTTEYPPYNLVSTARQTGVKYGFPSAARPATSSRSRAPPPPSSRPPTSR